ncbi:MAG: endolytic transglycosylase MltG [Thermoleophilia bacterium]
MSFGYDSKTDQSWFESSDRDERHKRSELESARRGPSGRPPRRRPPRVLRLLAVVVVVLLVVGLGVGLYLRSYFSSGRPGAVVSVTVPQGASLSRISQILEDAGVVRHAGAFSIRAQTDGYASEFKSGVYRLRRNEPYDTLVAALRHGPPQLVVTIPEGYTARQTAALLAEKIPGFSAQRYIDLTLLHPLPFRCPGFHSGGPLEGFLFPATYDVPPTISPRRFIAQQLAAFRATMAHVDLARAAAKNLTEYDVVIIGSMIEREIEAPAERPLAGAVIWNRLHLRMRLQIDATIEYALPAYKPVLTYHDLQIDSPYNTYLHAGLPPTPIANPGLASLKAAAHPAGIDYLYYVARNDGSGRHYFSASYAQFLKDKARAQQ